MPVKIDAEAKDGEMGLRKRVSRPIRETDFVYQVRPPRGRGPSKKAMARSQRAQELFSHSLVKIELDAAQALADFSRLAHMLKECSPSALKWSTKRPRSRRSYETCGAELEPQACGAELEPQVAHDPTDLCLFADIRRTELDSMTSVAYGDDKVSPSSNCQAESPISHLPTAKLACGTFLLTPGHSSQSMFQRVALPERMQEPSLASIKLEMDDLQSESLPSARQQQQKPLIATMSLPLIKAEVYGKQEEGCTDPPTAAGAKDLVNLASQLVELSYEGSQAVLKRPKRMLSEKDKEARRLRRIQANRESARQAIRKKQFRSEKLRQRALCLMSENEGLKQRKEILMQEFTFLEAQNCHLKAKLGIGLLPSELEPAETLQHSQGIPLSSVEQQGLSFPSQLMGWPRMTVQVGAPVCTDVPDKAASLEELSRNSSNNQAMPLLSNAKVIKVGRLSCVMGIAEQKCCHISNYISSLMPTNSSREENGAAGSETLKSTVGSHEENGAAGTETFKSTGGSHEENGAAGTETLKSSGGSCDADSATSNAPKVSKNDADAVSLEAAGPVKERIAPYHTTLSSFRGGSGAEEKLSENRVAFSVAPPVTLGFSSSRTGCAPRTGSGFVSSAYGWRATQRRAVAAAEARKRRLELTREKRLSVKKIKAG